jgi:hypothetical protein
VHGGCVQFVAVTQRSPVRTFGCPCRKLKLEHIDGVARLRWATSARARFGTHHAEPARPFKLDQVERVEVCGSSGGYDTRHPAGPSAVETRARLSPAARRDGPR